MSSSKSYLKATMHYVFDLMIEIKLQSEQDLKGYTVIETFPGVGLVGPMAGSYIIEKLAMEPIGYIVSEGFPPIASIHNSTPMHPARIYKSQKYKLLIFLSEFAIPPQLVYPLADELMAFARKYEIQESSPWAACLPRSRRRASTSLPPTRRY